MSVREGLFVVDDADAGRTSPTEARIALGGLMAPDSGGIAVRPGVLYGPTTGTGLPGQVRGTSATAPMTYVIEACQWIGVRTTAAGPYLASNDALLSVAVPAAPGSGSRYDLVWVRQPDFEQGDSDSVALAGITSGTASGSPTKPYISVPAGALVLAECLMPSGTTQTNSGVTITQVYKWTVARGAPIPVRSQTERDALTAYDGLEVWRLDTSPVRREFYAGSAWNLATPVSISGVTTTPKVIKTGSTAGTTTGSGDLTINTGLSVVDSFVAWNGDGPARPNMVIARNGGTGSNVTVKCWIGSTGAIIAGFAARIDWQAVGTA